MNDQDTRPSSGEHFSEEASSRVVNGRMGMDADPRLREVMAIVVEHLHAAIKEARITSDEWMKAIRFLTEVGHTCSEWRQEFILLSDVLGVSMLVDALNHRRPQGSTENTVLGPFYRENPPKLANGANICLDGKGEPMLVRGRVVDGKDAPIAGATVDVWQTNDDGFYDVQQAGLQPDYNLRGVFTTDGDGRYAFWTVKPRFYPIPDDGPVGKMLHALGRHPNRAAHLHFILTAEGFETVVTHIFTPDCPYLGEDAVFGVKQSLIADIRRVELPEAEREFAQPRAFWSVDWDFVMVPQIAA